MSETTTPRTVTIKPNGPILIDGPVTLTKPDGETVTADGVVALCRCGESANKPMCDGTHKRCGFSPD